MSFVPFGAQISRPIVMGRSGAVVAGHHLAAQAGLDILRAGGNAIDAAIAAAAALAVLKPDACGLGSDLFLLYGEAASGKAYALNASGPAPQLATPAAFGADIPEHGLRASAVPGAVHGWETALARFGRKSLAEVLAPAIALARDGMPVSQLFGHTLSRSSAIFDRFPATAAVFRPGGNVRAAGDNLVQADAAHTLAQIAAGGAAAYYEGDFAKALDAHARETNAFLRADDLRSYRSEWREPLRIGYRGAELIAQPPVSVGIVVHEALRMLEATPFASYADASADFIHMHVEAMKLAMADLRGHVGDPAFASPAAVTQLLDRGYTARRARAIAADRAQSPPAGALDAKPASDTSYVAVIDADGNAVSMLQSVFAVWGSGVVVPGTGVLMNNRMTGFSLDPASPNVVAPGKRPLHTLNPHMIRTEDGRWISLGTPGGPSQTYSHSLLITRLVDRGLDIQQAVEAPRWFVTPGGELHVESSVGTAVCDELARRGHRLEVDPPLYVLMGGAGIAQANAFGLREAAADPRRESYALAY